jgi:hypothetical protein
MNVGDSLVAQKRSRGECMPLFSDLSEIVRGGLASQCQAENIGLFTRVYTCSW